MLHLLCCFDKRLWYMAIARRMLIEVVLMILLGSIETLQRQHLDSQRCSAGCICNYAGQKLGNVSFCAGCGKAAFSRCPTAHKSVQLVHINFKACGQSVQRKADCRGMGLTEN